jgi:hypothetical protein
MKLFELHEQFDAQKFLADCKPWLDAIRGTENVALRGDNRVVEDFQLLTQKGLRRPKDLPLFIHDAINDEMQEKFYGWRARERGIFVVGQESKARLFGTLGAFFPVGEFKSVWSPDVMDLMEEWESFVFNLDSYDARDAKDGDERFTKQFAKEMLTSKTWHLNSEIKECLNNSISELIISAKTFYAFKLDSHLWENIVVPLLKSEGILA